MIFKIHYGIYRFLWKINKRVATWFIIKFE